jgi:hypothetical protein
MQTRKHWRDPATGVEYHLNRTSKGDWIVGSVERDPRPPLKAGLFHRPAEPPPYYQGSVVHSVRDDD